MRYITFTIPLIVARTMRPRNTLLLPIAVLIAVGIVGFSAWHVSRDGNDDAVASDDQREELDVEQIRTIQPDDHVFGNPNAQLIFIVYSDFGCPYCRTYHATMHSIINLYGGDGDVAWVYRHLPLVSLHPEAPMYALASECVADLGGNQAFWDFSDDLFEKLEPGVIVEAQGLLDLAEDVGVSRVDFASCMRSNELMDKVEEDFNEIVDAGVVATPYTVVISSEGRTSYEGAQPFLVLAGTVRSLIQLSNTEPLASPSSQSSFSTEFSDVTLEQVADAPFATSTVQTPPATTSTPQ